MHRFFDSSCSWLRPAASRNPCALHCASPSFDDSKYPSPDEVIQERKEITERSGLFTDIKVKEYNWIQSCSSDEYVALLNTNSKHQQLLRMFGVSFGEKLNVQ